jgi:hypothetical protein
MYKYLTLGIFIVCSILNGAEPTTPHSIHVTYDRKGSKKELPNFRIAHDAFHKNTTSTASRIGLVDLHASASGQLTPKEIATLKDKVGAKELILIDLRREQHAFVNGISVHWKDKLRENQFIKEITKHHRLISAKRKDLHISENSIITTEAAVAQQHGIIPKRFPTASGEIPSDTLINAFVELIETFDSDTWVHFHCRQGNGRATTYFIMYDMLHNADKVSFEDIIGRHYALGGAEIGTKSKYAAHRKMLKKFYVFAKNKMNQPSLTWQAFIQQ